MNDTCWFLMNSWNYMEGQRRKFWVGLPKAYWKFMRLQGGH